jgi:ligand-binding SRPBCC domain-containing protein
MVEGPDHDAASVYEMRVENRLPDRLRWRGDSMDDGDCALAPPREFVQIQLAGPYKFWHHTHRFERQRGGTCITDIVQYALPLGPLGWLANALWVRRYVRRMLAYRRKRIGEMFVV